jgi:FGGY-family pentulose kinase
MPTPPNQRFFIGVDVGTGSVRAGVFDGTGKMHGAAVRPIQIWKPAPDFVEQSSEDIWNQCVESVRAALDQAGIAAAQVEGLGFDATCSLVVLDSAGKQVSVSPSGNDAQNVIVWMDHRAIDQAARINATKDEVLRYVGGVISPEMESPKLLWLKEQLPANWRRAGHFFDLPDFLTYRATGDIGRSLCSLVCKWTYLGHHKTSDDKAGWSDVFWRIIGLADLVEEGYQRIGTKVRPMGEPVGNGLTAEAAAELGLRPGIAVGASIIDAHAGGLGVLGAVQPGEILDAKLLEERVAMIAGTSSCLMAVSPEPRYIHGVWGPYYSAMIPGLWLTEGGQSATGALFDHLIYNHAAYTEAKKEADRAGLSIFDFLNRRLKEMQPNRAKANIGELTEDFHLYPDFHGNRSPRANPNLRGMISGLQLSATIDDLALLYLAAIQAIAYQVRHIVEEMNRQGYRISKIFACGGGLKNDVFLREHVDITGCDLVLPKEPEAVLLGSAILGAVAAKAYPTILEAMTAMTAVASTIEPNTETAGYHRKKYQVYHRMYDDQMAYRELMKGNGRAKQILRKQDL